MGRNPLSVGPITEWRTEETEKGQRGDLLTRGGKRQTSPGKEKNLRHRGEVFKHAGGPRVVDAYNAMG